jgi:hypothetical protein
MDDFNWEYTKEANFDLFGEEFSAYCTDDGEESSNTDSMKPCYHTNQHVKCSTSSTLSDESSGDGVFLRFPEAISLTRTNVKQDGDSNCFENEYSTYDSDLDSNALTSADLIMSPFFQSYSPSHKQRTHSPGSFSSKECSSAVSSCYQTQHRNNPKSPSEHPSVTSPTSSSTHPIGEEEDEDEAFIALYHTEMEFQELMASHTDPVGKVGTCRHTIPNESFTRLHY